MIQSLQAGKAILLAGIAFFLSLSLRAADPLDLALDLFGEGDLRAAGREARRVELAQPANATARVVRAIAALSLRGPEGNLGVLAAASTNAALSADFRALAAYHLGVHRIRRGGGIDAVEPFRLAFLATRDPHLFAPSALALATLAERHPDAVPPDLLLQVRSVQAIADPAARREVAGWFNPPPEPRPPAGVRWVVGFYRTQINPAIGSRCAMHPSCSEYFRQAAQKHGMILGMAMGADRLCREPDHAKYRLDAINVGGLEKYHDPVSAHDEWMNP